MVRGVSRTLRWIFVALSWVAVAQAGNLPGFRGSTRQGVFAETNLPLHGSREENLRWKTPIAGSGRSSPVGWGEGGIYFLSEGGETIAIETGREYKEIARNRLEEHTQAPMAVSGGRFEIRTSDRLWAIGAE